MAKFQILTDSCSDLPLKEREAHNLDYCRMNIVLDGEERVADLDWNEYSPEELYGWLAAGRHLKTTQVPIAEFINRFTPYLEKGIDVLYIACTSKCSGSINVFEIAKEQLLEQFPDRKIIGIDSLNACLGEGLLSILASEKQKEGASIEEVERYVLSIRNNIVQFATVETLSYLKASGRIKATKAIMGNLLHKKPVFISDAHGDNYTLGTVTGTKNADAEIVKGVIARVEKERWNKVYIGQGMALERAKRIKEKIEEGIPGITAEIYWIGPVIGISCGPGVLAVFGAGKEVTCFADDGNKPSLDYSKL